MRETFEKLNISTYEYIFKNDYLFDNLSEP